MVFSFTNCLNGKSILVHNTRKKTSFISHFFSILMVSMRIFWQAESIFLVARLSSLFQLGNIRTYYQLYNVHQEDQANGLQQKQRQNSILLKLTHAETYRIVQPAKWHSKLLMKQSYKSFIKTEKVHDTCTIW